MRRKRPKPHRQCRTVWGIRILVLVVLLGYLIFSADQCLARGVQEYAAFECERIAALIGEQSGKDTIMWDERCTTVSAIHALNVTNTRGKKRKAVVDAVAAVMILQSYIDYRRTGGMNR